MLHILYSVVWAIAPGPVDYIGVVARNGLYPKEPRPGDRKAFAAFCEKYGPQPPWDIRLGSQPSVECLKRDGEVLKVSEKFIEIRLLREEKTVKVAPHELLASGKIVAWEHDSCAYLLADVKKGDLVVLAYGRPDPDKEPEAFWVCIRERPGGRVPPPRKLVDVHMYHLDRQAEIDHRDKGTPLPEHLRPKPRPVKAPPPAGTSDQKN